MEVIGSDYRGNGVYEKGDIFKHDKSEGKVKYVLVEAKKPVLIHM